VAVATITSNLIQSGPGRIYTAPLGTTIPTITALASKITATWTNWVQAGSTDAGITYTEAVQTADIQVAESLYPIRTVTTSKTSRVAFTMNEISDLNWKVAMNGGTIVVTGATTTKLSEFSPPLAGAEVRIMMAFVNYDDTEAIIWPQVFNVGSVEYARGTLETKAGLPCEFNAEIPATGYVTPYKRFVSGALALSP
jgi:hypothetical protein